MKTFVINLSKGNHHLVFSFFGGGGCLSNTANSCAQKNLSCPHTNSTLLPPPKKNNYQKKKDRKREKNLNKHTLTHTNTRMLEIDTIAFQTTIQLRLISIRILFFLKRFCSKHENNGEGG